jgi:hypothetical protein
VATTFGGAGAPSSRRKAKLLWREVCAAVPAPEGTPPLKWSDTPVTFDQGDHPSNTTGVGLLPVVVTPTICNIGVGRTLVDGGAGLNLLSPKVFHQIQIRERKLTPSPPFCGVTNGKTLSLGQIDLPVTFGRHDNFHTESITFHVAYFDLPYNAILGRPALAKFMAAVHYAYNVLKIPGPTGIISIKANVKGVVYCTECLFEAVAASPPDNADRSGSSSRPPTKQRISPDSTDPHVDCLPRG